MFYFVKRFVINSNAVKNLRKENNERLTDNFHKNESCTMKSADQYIKIMKKINRTSFSFFSPLLKWMKFAFDKRNCVVPA